MHDKINTPNAPAAIGPYSQAVSTGDTLYVSGQIPLDPKTGEVVGSNVTDQTRQVMKNLVAIIEASGFSLDNVVKCSCFLTDMGTFAEFNGVYESVFSEVVPARECVAVSALPKGVSVEVSAVCHK